MLGRSLGCLFSGWLLGLGLLFFGFFSGGCLGSLLGLGQQHFFVTGFEQLEGGVEQRGAAQVKRASGQCVSADDGATQRNSAAGFGFFGLDVGASSHGC